MTSVSEARKILPELIRRVTEGEEVILSRHGEPVAVLIRPDARRTRCVTEAYAESEDIYKLVAESRKQPLEPDGSSLSEQRAAELLAEILPGRSAH